MGGVEGGAVQKCTLQKPIATNIKSQPPQINHNKNTETITTKTTKHNSNLHKTKNKPQKQRKNGLNFNSSG